MCYDLIIKFGGKMKKFTCSKRKALILLSIFLIVELFVSSLESLKSLKGGIHFIPMLIDLIIFILLLFFCGCFWLIKYDDLGFTYTGIGRYKIEYDDIVSVTHFYKDEGGFRPNVEQFTIKYSCIVRNSDEREIKKLNLGNLPEKEAREFFSHMKKCNPKIDFSFQMAKLDSVEIKDFDYF